MARKRDYAKEYAAAKQRATNAGYKSQREYKKARKASGLGRARASVVPKRVFVAINPEVLVTQSLSAMRAECAAWSAKHSRVPSSRYDTGMSDAQVIAYYNAYVYDGDKMTKLLRIHDYVIPFDYVTEDQWKRDYLGIR